MAKVIYQKLKILARQARCMVYALTLRYNCIMELKKTVSIKWSSKLAYATGLIASDGNLSSDGRHIVFVSKDLKLVKVFQKCLGLRCKIATKASGFTKSGKYYYVQFGDVKFYRFLQSIGLTPAKSKTLAALGIPDEYFFDFLRGSFDGDGTFYSYWDKRWASSYLFYLVFTSASLDHLTWLQSGISRLRGLKGRLSSKPHSGAYQLRYAKQEALVIFKSMYYSVRVPRLERKYKKVYTSLAIERKHNSARVL